MLAKRMKNLTFDAASRGTCIYCCICILVQNRFLLFCQLVLVPETTRWDVARSPRTVLLRSVGTPLPFSFTLYRFRCTWLTQFIRSTDRLKSVILPSQRCLCKCNRLRRVKITSLSLESRSRSTRRYKQVSTFTAVDTWLALCTNTDTLTIVNTCRKEVT